MKVFIDSAHILETGIEHTSPHLRWLIRNVAIEHCGKDAIDIITYHKDIPNSHLGESIAIVKGIVINLSKHVEEAFERVCAEENINTSIRAHLIQELIDTTIHEAHHLKVATETNNFEDDYKNEDEARAIAKRKVWLSTKNLDAEIFTFGPVIDAFLEETIQCFKEDVKEKPELWKELQIYMWENKLAYYDPEKEKAYGIRTLFEALERGLNDSTASWLNEPIKFIGEVKIGEATVTPNQPTMLKTIADIPPSPQTITTQQLQQSQQFQQAQQFPQPQQPQTIPTYIGEDASESYTIDYLQEIGNQYTQTQPLQTTFQHQLYTPTLPEGYLTREEIQTASEMVIRTLFWHIVNKCEHTTEGGYNNPQAVLEPISIAHIPHASQIFTHMTTVDENGVTLNQTPCNGIIKGKVSKTSLMPMYELYLNFNGELHKRIFIPTNPNKTDNTGKLTGWAEKVRNGGHVMMFLSDKEGVRAEIILEPGKHLGQEVYKLRTPKIQKNEN